MKNISITVQNHFDAGYRLGTATKELQLRFLSSYTPKYPWEKTIALSLPYLKASEKAFPRLVEEVRGLAQGLAIPFEKVWAMHCMEEITHEVADRCSSVFVKTGDGWLVGHNEDWHPSLRGYYFIVTKSIAGMSITYLASPFRIGGDTVSRNSSGLIQTINSLDHRDIDATGVPKDIIACATAAATSLEEVKDIFNKTKRAAGYCHNMIIDGDLYCIESTADRYEFVKTGDVFAHTNHYFGSLKSFDREIVDDSMSTVQRHLNIMKHIAEIQKADDMRNLLLLNSDSSGSIYRAIGDSVTMASVVIDNAGKNFSVTDYNKGRLTEWDNIYI